MELPFSCSLLQGGDPALIIFASPVPSTMPEAHNWSINVSWDDAREDWLAAPVTSVT